MANTLSRVVLALTTCILAAPAACGQGAGPPANPPPRPAAKADPPPYINSPLKNVPELQVRVTCSIPQPTAKQVVALLRERTGVALVLDESVDATRPALGSLSARNTPAWVLLAQLANSRIIQGEWARDGAAFRLTSPLPPPPPEERVAAEQLEDRPTFSTQTRFYLLSGCLAMAALLLAASLARRRRPGLPTPVEVATRPTA